jgi:hypothetical protein
MSNDITEPCKNIVDEMKRSFGPPPVLSSEDLEAYDRIMTGFVKCFSPRDFFEQLLLKVTVDATWEYIRYSRHKTLAIERKFRQSFEFQEKRKKILAQRREEQRKDALESKELQESGDLTPEQRKFALEWSILASAEEVDELLEHAAEERDHARALENGIVYYQALNDLAKDALHCRDDSLEQLERYREGLGASMRAVSDEIIDAEFKIAGPASTSAETPLVPENEQKQ